eukprot:7374325-Pyramimonas_sp.AAC.1
MSSAKRVVLATTVVFTDLSSPASCMLRPSSVVLSMTVCLATAGAPWARSAASCTYVQRPMRAM